MSPPTDDDEHGRVGGSRPNRDDVGGFGAVYLGARVQAEADSIFNAGEFAHREGIRCRGFFHFHHEVLEA